MKKGKDILNKILHPSLVVLITIPLAAFTGLIYIFAENKTRGASAYVFYILSAYSLVILLLKFFGNIGKTKRKFSETVLKKAENIPILKKYLTDSVFKGEVSLLRGAIFDIGYTVFRMVTGFIYSSVWFVSLSFYHLFLGLLRVYLIVCQKKRLAKDLFFEYNCYEKTAWLLFFLNIPMSGMTVLMVIKNSGFSYPGYVIYVSAMYTFYTVISSAINLAKYRKAGSPIISAAKVISFITALMSVLGLQTAMISAFSTNGDGYRRMMNAITGAVVFGAVIVVAVYMLIKAYRKKTEIKNSVGGKTMNRSESKYYHTACLMDEAFLLILEKKEFEYITIGEICAKAGVNRSTFYLHYEKLSDLLDESLRFVSNRFLEYFHAKDVGIVERIKTCTTDELFLATPQYLLPYLEFILEYKKLYRAALKNHTLFHLDHTYEKMFTYVFNPILDCFGVSESQRRFIMGFYINGLMAIVAEWLKTDCKESPQEIVEIIQKCVKRS